MKDKLIYIFIGIVIIVTIIFVTLITTKNIKKNKKIENITYLRLTYTAGYAMNAYTVYEINLKEDKYIAIIKPYGEPEENTREYELPKEKVKELEKTLSNLKVAGWDGFHGNDKYVLDGDSFSFSLRYGDNESISASGYMSWPENYGDVISYISEMLNVLHD